MKYFAVLFFVVMLFGCSKEDELKLEAYNAEAFAFEMNGFWEVNASARVKGFKQFEENETFSVSLAYDIDVVTPEGDTLKSLITRVEEKESKEKLTDIPLDVQFELDSTYSTGNYTIIFNVNDPETGNSASAKADFDL